MTAHNRPFWRRLAQAAAKPATSAVAAQNLAAPAGLGSSMRPLALEQRFMFDGAGAADAAHAVADGATATDAAADTAGALRHALMAEAAPASSQRQEVVFVDSQVANLAELLAGLSGNAEVVILDASKDGLQQMADYLQGRSGLDAIHLLSHGADGTVQLGNVWLASTNLAEHRAALESIGATLKADGDLMIYGCDVGQGDKGQAFIDQLAAITGADVAASVDDTGAAVMGGNWILERSSGSIETSALNVSGYDYLMASTYTLSNVLSAVGMGTGNNLMKYVLADFNGDGRADVLYQASGTGGAWSFASSNADGSYSIQTQANSMFANLTLGAFSTGGTNFQAADFNGDGRIDLLAASISDASMKLYINNGSNFTATDVAGTFGGVKLLVGDYNGDGSPDILYQGSGTGAPWGMLLNNGSGGFTTVLDSDSNWALKNVTMPNFDSYIYKAADVDGDGYTDLMVIAGGSQMKYYRNNNGTFVDMTSSANLPTPLASRAIVADFDGDGDADILYQVNGDGTEIRYVKNNNGVFVDGALSTSPFSTVTLPDLTGQRLRAADIDGDGDLDLVATYPTSGTTVFLQSGSLPKLVSSTPADNSLTVTPSANITLTFDQSVTKGTGNIYIVRTSDNQIIQTIDVTTASVTGSGTTWTIDPPADMVAGVAYAVRIDSKTFANANGQVYKGIQDNTALNFTVFAVAAPVIGNVNGNTVSYAEGAAYVLLDDGSNATVTDADSANFAGGKLTVQVTANRVDGQDVLFIRDQGNGANLITVSGASILYNGLVIGTFTGGSNGNPLVVSFTSNANPTTVSALVQNVAYRNSNTVDPTTTQRSVSISMDDGAGGNSAMSVVTLNVLPVNDAPSFTKGSNLTVSEDAGAQSIVGWATGISAGPADESGQTLTFTVSNTNNALFSVQPSIDGSGTLSFILAANAYGVTTVTVTLKENGGTANGGIDTSAAQTFTITVSPVNDVPFVSGPIPAQGVLQDSILSFTVPAGTFSDPDGDTLALSATLADGSALPAWLTFNAATHTFSGTPGNADVGVISIKLTATDPGNASASTTFSLFVVNVNDAPAVSIAIPAQSVTENANLSFTVPAGTFTDPDGDILTLSATLADGSALPAWLTFNAATKTFSGTPGNSDVGSISIKVTASDGDASVSTTFTLNVVLANDAPQVSGVVPPQSVAQDGSFSLLIPPGLFIDPDGDTLTLSATLADGSALPAWLTFNPVTRTFSGTPGNADVGNLSIKITAIDPGNASVSTTFALTVTNVNDAPVIGSTIAPQNIAQAGSLNFTVPAGTFIDPDGDPLTLSATLADGSALPAWLQFDPATRTFSGTPGNADVGLIGIKLTATDPSNASVSTTFALIVTNVNDAPVVGAPVPPQSIPQDGSLNFTLPAGTFVDPDGDTLTLSATQADGSALPAWLTFNPATGTFSGTPGSNDIGSLSIKVTANDGDASVSTTFSLTVTNVIPVNPTVTSVSAQGPDRAVKAGDEVLISMTWDQAVNVDLSSGSPTLLLETGLVDRNAVYVSGSGSNTLVFKYTVQAGDTSADLDFQSTAALQLNGAVVANASNNLAVLTLPTVGGADSLGGRSNIVVDTTTPDAATVNALQTDSLTPTLTGTATLAAGETLTVTVGGASYQVTPVAGVWSLDLATAVPDSGALVLVLNRQYNVVTTTTDLAGNESTRSGSLIVGTVTPEQPIVPVLPDTSAVLPPSLPPAASAPDTVDLSPVASPAAPQILPQSGVGSELVVSWPGQAPATVLDTLPSFGPLLPTQPTPDVGLTSAEGFQIVALPGMSGGNALVAYKPIPDVVASSGERIAVQISSDAFAYADGNAVVTLSARMTDGKALPGWLRFDARTGRFEGTPPPGFEGTLSFRVTVRDSEGRVATQVFKLVVSKDAGKTAFWHGDGSAPAGRASLSEQLRSARGAAAARLAVLS